MTEPDAATGNPRWSDARRRMAQLETSASAMSSTWFMGMSGLIAAAVMFVASGVILALCLARLQQHFVETQQAEHVLSETVGLQEALDEAIAAGRGYIATHDAGLLKMREEAKRTAREHVALLGVLLRDKPEAERAIQTITPVIFRRMRLFDEMIALSRMPNASAKLQAGESEYLGLVHQTNGRLSQLVEGEQKAIAEERRLARFDISFAIILVLLTGVIAPLCGLFGVLLLRRERDSQRARELQLELMHVQRLGIMGQTAAMLAHELNQPLTAATNFLAALRRNLESAPEKAPAIAERIGQQIQRASGIVRKLRQFIEKRESERSVETPDVLIEDAVSLLGTIDPNVTLKTELADELPCVMVDRVQLQQVLVNLMRNAIEAMADCPRRELTLSAVALDKATVEISLADTGPGLPKEVAERLFQPFVSTKPNGMGVGLSICQTIIAQHDGRIWAEPGPGGGTIFRFTLPAQEERAAA